MGLALKGGVVPGGGPQGEGGGGKGVAPRGSVPGGGRWWAPGKEGDMLEGSRLVGPRTK